MRKRLSGGCYARYRDRRVVTGWQIFTSLGGIALRFSSFPVVLSCAMTGATRGIEGFLVRVEVYLADGVPAFHTVGLPDTSVREARERVRAALTTSGFKFPERRITINLAPADVPKQGSGFDLAVAVGLLAAKGAVSAERLESTLLMGELALDGGLRPVRGVLPVAVEARTAGLAAALVPKLNGEEAALVEGLAVYPVSTLREVVNLLTVGPMPKPYQSTGTRSRPNPGLADLADVKAQYGAKRALELAAAGGHNLLFYGPPGAGKTLLARRLPSLLPPLRLDEAIEVTKVHSVAGKLSPGVGLLTEPPFRAPHHTISWAAMAGGGPGPMPGEVSLAHRGVLFLDELAEFPRNALESLRQPLEEGSILVSRVGRSVRMPSRFTLIAAMNPCRCGYLGAEARACSCSPGLVRRYRSRVSGPLIDRIDLQVYVRALNGDQLLSPASAEPSSVVRERVVRARAIQAERFAQSHLSHSRINAAMTPREVIRFCELSPAGRSSLRRAVDGLGLSARAFDRVLKVARTIADLEGESAIRESHLQEAIEFRSLDSEQVLE